MARNSLMQRGATRRVGLVLLVFVAVGSVASTPVAAGDSWFRWNGYRNSNHHHRSCAPTYPKREFTRGFDAGAKAGFSRGYSAAIEGKPICYDNMPCGRNWSRHFHRGYEQGYRQTFVKGHHFGQQAYGSRRGF